MNPLADVTRQQLREAEALDYVRIVGLRAKHHGFTVQALDEFRARWPESVLLRRLEYEEKAAISPGTTSDATWGAPLALAQPSTQGFAEMVRANTILGRLPGVRRVPLNSLLPIMTTGVSAAWSGENISKAISSGAFSNLTLAAFKATAIIVVTRELTKLAVPGADVLLRDELRRAVATYLDEQAFNPAVAAVANVNPQSLTNGAPSFAASGTSAANAATDIKKLVSDFIAASPDAEALVLLMAPSTAVALAIATASTTLRATGGELFGIDVITSTSVAGMIILLDANQIVIAEEPGIRLDMSEETTLEMQTTPATPGTASTVYESLFQRDLAAVRAEKFITWARLRTAAVRLVTGVAYV